MKLILISLGLLCSFFDTSKQDETLKESILTAHLWEIKTHSMSGIGIHKSIPKGTTVEFLNNKTWKSSELMENFKTGNWSFENKGRTLSMTFGSIQREFLVQELTTDKLRYRLSKYGAVYNFEWIVKH